MARNQFITLLNEAMGLRAEKKKPSASFSGPEKAVIDKVVHKLREGESQLKHLLERGYTIYQVISAIKNKKCIANLGSTYLEQTIAGCLRDLVKDGRLKGHLVDQYRRIFGLPPVSKKGEKKYRPKAAVSRIPKSEAHKLSRALGIKHAKRSRRIGEPG